jgi:predicted dehydrogenase/threonine dehydrogenase-like Zn-dependent dehydrogenase
MPTIETVFNKLDEPLPLGYCNVGEVVELSSSGGKSKFSVGDRIASNGKHAEYVCVPENLCARIPDNVTDDEAAFTVVGAIALQGVRLCNPTFGETIVVVGLGLIGLLTAQFLLANGCRVVGVDIAPEKLKIAAQWGVLPVNPKESDPVAAVMQLTGEAGADGVVITASAKGDEIITQAAHMSRKRGRIILVGVVGLHLNRADFYEKELTFQVSCSYGPGRYDDHYEQKGIDYPIGFVRWTEQRNFEAVLHAISTGRLDVKSLITERVPLEDFQKIYGNMGISGAIASILVYPEARDSASHLPKLERTIQVTEPKMKSGAGTVGIIGAGNFTKMTLLPALKRCATPIGCISSAGGLSGTHLAKKYGIARSTTDYRDMLKDPQVKLVIITTRHDLHAKMVVDSLQAGKDVFVEKPLCLNREELAAITDEVKKGSGALMVGFNRRFSPHIQAIKKALGENPGPLNLTATMNAGAIPTNVWVQDMQVGGGRIIGEACHYLDLLVYLAGSPIKAVCMNALGTAPGENTDNAAILLRFANGSNGVVNYFANGHKGYSKERVEVYSQGRVAVMDNFRKTEAYGFNGFKGLKTRIDKGHAAQFKLLTDRLRNGGEVLIPFHETENVTRASFACIECLKRDAWVTV